jgi:hypothetical protein
MKKTRIIISIRIAAIALILTMSSYIVAGAANFVNGDFEAGETGWTRWQASWGSGGNWAVLFDGGWSSNIGQLQLPPGNSSSLGWYQRVPVTMTGTYTLNGEWAGNIGTVGWAEIMYFPASSATSNADIVTRIDTGNAADIAFKKDSWGMNPPTNWSRQAMSLSLHPSGNGGTITVTAEDQVVVAIKLGSVSGAAAVNLQVDNLDPRDPNAVTLRGFEASNPLTPGTLIVPVVGLAAGVGTLALTFVWRQRRRRGNWPKGLLHAIPKRPAPGAARDR